MSTRIEKHRTPLFSISKRNDLSLWKRLLIRGIMLTLALLVSLIISLIIIKEPVGELLSALFEGAFLMPDKLFLDACLLLGFGIAVVPAFKMRYWNMGANGQVLAGALVAVVLMFYMGNWASKSGVNNTILIVLMLVGSVLASVIWAIIPAIFKALFGTNETLFTLMMNYIAIALVSYVNFVMTKGSKESVGIVNPSTHAGWFPTLFNNDYIIPIIVIIIMTMFVAFYMSKTKHGFETIVCGDSIKTARYVGMNTKKITIRTLILSGVLTGIIGFLYASAIDHTVTFATGGLGFTAVLLSWLCNFSPIVIGAVSLFLAFLTLGTKRITSKFRLGSNDLSNVIIGLIFFSILISEFFIRYNVKINLPKKKREVEEV